MIVSRIVFLATFITTDSGFFAWLNKHLLACPFKSFTGIDCPGCGVQRSLVALLKGDLVSSFHYYPATTPILFLFALTAFHLIFDFKNGAYFIKMLYIVITLIIVTNYIYKIFTHQLI